jgi:hypothetical protein
MLAGIDSYRNIWLRNILAPVYEWRYNFMNGCKKAYLFALFLKKI